MPHRHVRRDRSAAARLVVSMSCHIDRDSSRSVRRLAAASHLRIRIPAEGARRRNCVHRSRLFHPLPPFSWAPTPARSCRPLLRPLRAIAHSRGRSAMSKIAKQHKTDAFVIPLTETCVVLSDQIEMSENDLKKFRGVHPLYKAFAATFGSRLGPPPRRPPQTPPVVAGSKSPS